MLVAASPGTARADCKPTAVPAGDPVLVQSLATRLAASGIATTPTAGCPAMQVHIEQRGQQYRIRLIDAYQRQGEREVRDLATAAAVIESWSLQEIDEGALPAVSEAPASPVVTAHLVRSGIAASFAPSLGSNSTTWLGGAMSACLRTGPICTGATVRAALDTTATGETTTIAQDARTIEALATAELPRRLGRFIVSPGIGIGYSWLGVTTHHRDAQMNPLDIATTDHQLRAGLHVSVTRPMTSRIALYGDVSGDGAVLRTDSSAGPAAAIRIGIGVRLEAP